MRLKVNCPYCTNSNMYLDSELNGCLWNELAKNYIYDPITHTQTMYIGSLSRRKKNN